MSNSLTSQGLTTTPQATLLSNATASYQSIYGSDIDLDSDTPDGQNINIQIQSQLDVQDLLMQIYSSFDLNQAIGIQLDQRVALIGIKRLGGTYSITDVTLVLTQSVNLYGLDQTAQTIYTVSDSSGNQWQLIATQLGAGPGTVSYSFQATTPGASLTIPNTITVPITIILGVQSINNPSAQSIVGINAETDASLRIRALKSVSISSQGYLQGLLAALENINGISSAFVYENRTNSTDIDGVPGHSIWVIVAGNPTVAITTAWNNVTTYSYGQIASSGAVNYISWQNNNTNNPVTDTAFWGLYNPVAQTIYQKRNAGCGMYGQTSYMITQIDGTLFTVNWDVVTELNLFISFTATSINGVNQPNISGIISGLVNNFVPTVYQEVNINQMATIVQQTDPNCLVTNAGFSLGLTQIANLSGVAASGTFEFRYNGHNSAAINWNDNTSTIQSTLRAVTGLSAAVVTGTIAGQSLSIALNVTSANGLITVVSNSLMTSVPVAITFSFNEGYSNTLTPTTKSNQFKVTAANIIILPMILSPSTVSVVEMLTQQFTGLGGYGTLVYSLTSNVSGGSIDSSTGLYTAGSSPGTDVAKVTDSFGNTATATITVTS